MNNYYIYKQFAVNCRPQLEKEGWEFVERKTEKVVVMSKLNKKLIQEEINNHTEWFKNYDNQVAQYLRCERLGVPYNKDIKTLDKEALEHARMIKELGELLNE